jgi:Flp pilus assembly protein TadG
MVEAAAVIPVLLILTIGTCIVGMGIYYYQQVATLAREAARYASVHGSGYALDEHGGVNVTESTMYTNAILPMAAGLNTNNLTYQIKWGTKVSGNWKWTNWGSASDPAPTSPNPNSNPAGQPLYNAVEVTVTYQWMPQLYLAGPINLTSKSVMPMSY